MNKLYEMFLELQKQHFFGSVEVKMENGKVVIVRKTQTLKLDPDNGRNGGNYGDNPQARLY